MQRNVFAIIAATTVLNGFPAGAKGPDLELEAISPENESIDVGLAGEDPADIARYLLARGAGAAALSPDGESVAFISSVTGKRQLWRLSAEGGAPTQLTFGNGVTFFRWSPDGDSLIYGADNNGDEQEAYYRIAADGSSEALVLAAVDGGFRRFGDFSADGKTITYASTERNGLDFDIYAANIETGEATRLFEGKFGFFARSISPSGDAVIVTETVGEDANNLYLLDVASGDLKTISKPDPRASHGNGGFAWTDDGGEIYYSSNLNREFAGLFAFDRSSDEASLIIDAERDVGNVSLCGADDRYLVWTENVDGFFTLHARDRRRNRDLRLPALPEGVYSVDCTENTPRLLVRVNGWKTPGDLYTVDLRNGSAERIFAANMAGLDPDTLVKPESVRMTARDGVELQGLLYLPNAASRTSDAPPPVLFLVHGGPSAQSAATWDAIVQYHADRGVAVFEPNVRGSTGFGRTYSTLDDREKAARQRPRSCRHARLSRRRWSRRRESRSGRRRILWRLRRERRARRLSGCV